MATYKLTDDGATVDTLLDVIGNDALDTTAQTLTGAVNEIYANSILYFTSQTVSVATNDEIFRITDDAITENTIVLSCEFAVPSYVKTDVTWESFSGYISFTGTCATATTADVILAKKI